MIHLIRLNRLDFFLCSSFLSWVAKTSHLPPTPLTPGKSGLPLSLPHISLHSSSQWSWRSQIREGHSPTWLVPTPPSALVPCRLCPLSKCHLLPKTCVYLCLRHLCTRLSCTFRELMSVDYVVYLYVVIKLASATSDQIVKCDNLAFYHKLI